VPEYGGRALPLTLSQSIQSDVLDVRSRAVVLVADHDLVGADVGAAVHLLGSCVEHHIFERLVGHGIVIGRVKDGSRLRWIHPVPIAVENQDVVVGLYLSEEEGLVPLERELVGTGGRYLLGDVAVSEEMKTLWPEAWRYLFQVKVLFTGLNQGFGSGKLYGTIGRFVGLEPIITG